MTQNWQPLTPAISQTWQRDSRTMWFRDSRGQIGFGTWDLAREMRIKVVEVAEIEDA